MMCRKAGKLREVQGFRRGSDLPNYPTLNGLTHLVWTLILSWHEVHCPWKRGAALGVTLRITNLPLENLHQLHTSLVGLDERDSP